MSSANGPHSPDDSQELVFGQHAVRTVLEKDPSRITQAWLQVGRDNKLARDLSQIGAKLGLVIDYLERREMDQRWPEARHQGVVIAIASASTQATPSLREILHNARPDSMLILLDAIEDPRNLGAVLRVADALAVDAVVVPRNRGTTLTPAARKVASGAAETVAFIAAANFARAIGEIQAAGFTVLGTHQDAEVELFDFVVQGPVALILGSEGQGLRRLTREACDVLLRLPMRGTVSSLNVSVAAGVCGYEIRRQLDAKLH